MRLVVLFTLLTIACPLLAHSHSMYDFGTNVSLQGILTNVRWVNPHVLFELELAEDGEDVVWVIEAEPPALMSKFGWSPDSVAPGDQVIISASPAQNPDRKMAVASSLEAADGTRLWISGRIPYDKLAEDLAEPFDATSLSGNWVTQLNPEVVMQYFHRQPSAAITDKGNASLRNVGDTLEPDSECLSRPIPYVMLLPVSTNIEIGDLVTQIRIEGDQGVVDRFIHMNLDTQEGAEYQNQGHSIGRWENGVLVVDTTHFAAHPYGHGRGLPSSPDMHLVERFELNADGTSLNYTFRVEDPEYLAEPAAATLRLLHRPDLEFLEIACDIESARQYLEAL